MLANPSQPNPSAQDGAKNIRVLFIDDEPKLTSALTRYIRDEPGLEPAGCMDTAAGIVEEVRNSRADVVVLDLTMPGPDPVQAIRDLAASVPACRVIAYSGYDDFETREEVRLAGAADLVGKGKPPQELVRVIRRVGATAAAHVPRSG